jgi:hypothetical protein
MERIEGLARVQGLSTRASPICFRSARQGRGLRRFPGRNGNREVSKASRAYRAGHRLFPNKPHPTLSSSPSLKNSGVEGTFIPRRGEEDDAVSWRCWCLYVVLDIDWRRLYPAGGLVSSCLLYAERERHRLELTGDGSGWQPRLRRAGPGISSSGGSSSRPSLPGGRR